MLYLKISRWHMGKSQETMQLSRLSRLLSLTLMGLRILSGIIDWCWNFSQYSIAGIGWTILLLFYLFVLCLTKAEIWLEILRHLGSSRKGMFTAATVTSMYIVHYYLHVSSIHYCYYSNITTLLLLTQLTLLSLQHYLSVYTVSATLKSCTLSKCALYMYIFQGLVCQWLERREDMEQGEFHSNVKEVLSWMITE